MGKKKGSSDKKGKRPHKNKPTGKKYSLYVLQGGNAKRKTKYCPRCGPGVFLAGGLGRLYCGKCHYTEFLDKK
jgi:ubiquitin-small subunit ribosomal protein S27Ae